MGRSIVGSGTNLASFTMLKEYLMIKRNWVDNAFLDIVGGLGSAVISVICMNPVDVVRTRYYNQTYVNGVGELYKSGGQALTCIFKEEGPSAFYKGLTTHFLRIGPHFCLTFLFLGIFRRQINEYYDFRDRRESFTHYDQNSDGKLNRDEIKDMVIKVVLKGNPNDELANHYTQRIISKAGNAEGFIVHSGKVKKGDEYCAMLNELEKIYVEHHSDDAPAKK
jgi:solute carrier family 25 protein 34/35